MVTHSDWLSLVELSGLVVSEPVLETHFPGGPEPIELGTWKWFRRYAERYEVSQADKDPDNRRRGATQWTDYLLEGLLELTPRRWAKANDVPSKYRVRLDEFDQWLRPSRVLLDSKGEAVLLVMRVSPEQALDRKETGQGRWKASPATKLERLLRETEVPLGLLCNGNGFRLIHARKGFSTGSISWSTRLLVEEKATADAFRTLLGKSALLPEDDTALTLADWCRESVDRQGDVADQLGEQVRNGLERLLWAWDEADRSCGSDLLRHMTEDRIYEMGLTVMMRLVFLLYAEERALLPHGEVLYDQGYGLTWLWHRLQEQRRHNPGLLQETHDGWDRFLATCRLLHKGSRHPDLLLPAYGGSLFDPDRFAVLEDPRCRVSNGVVADVLQLLLFARHGRHGEPQRVGYWALDVEQIGYVYEGLLDHRCARAGAQPVVKLKGMGEAAFPLDLLEKAAAQWKGPTETSHPDTCVDPPPPSLVQVVAAQLYAKPKSEHLDKVAAALSSMPSAADLDALALLPVELAERIRPFASVLQCDEVAAPKALYLTTGTSRRASGAHYTPQILTERVVRVTLEPQVYRCEEGKPGKYLTPRQVKSPGELLELKVCDIAMGSGAFLVQAVRYLADRLVESWDRAVAEAHEQDPNAVLTMPYAERMPEDVEASQRLIDPDDRPEMVLWARRLVVERCIYGVDINPLAVEMAKLSLWLTTLARDRAFTFLDHALKCGDSLMGVDEKQLSTWSLAGKGRGAPLVEGLLARQVKQARDLRLQLVHMPAVDAEDLDRKSSLLDQALAATEKLRLAGDALVAPDFALMDARQREGLRNSLGGSFSAREEEVDWVAVRSKVAGLLRHHRPFHWFLEFPEVFARDDGGFDAIVGNPPFVGGQFIRRQLGDDFLPWLRTRWPSSHGTADLVAFFFLRAFEALSETGSLGLVATNTVSQGDTRETGLEEILNRGGSIYAALPRMPWPGQASVNVSLVNIARSDWHGSRELDGQAVDWVSSLLDASKQETRVERLGANRNLSFQGSNILGLGFTMPPEEAQELIRQNPKNAEVLFPYINGEDLNSSPTQEGSRWVINFQDWPLQKAAEWPELLEIVREKVKPERDKVNRAIRRQRWWRFAEYAPNLYRTIAPLPRVLLCAQTSAKWAPAFSSTGIVYSHSVIVFAFEDWRYYSMMQSSFHEYWRLRYGPTLRTDARYTPSDCFETFPFPRPTEEQRALLERIGEAYHEHRRQILLKNQEGLTKTYNRFHDHDCHDPDIEHLRQLHVEMDLAVRDAYGWSDLELGHGWLKTVTVTEKKNRKTGKVQSVEKVDWRYSISDEAKDEVLRRLLDLNHKRYEEEVRQGKHDKRRGKGKKSGDGGVDSADEAAKPTGKTASTDKKPFRLSNPVDPKKGRRLL